MLADGVSGFDNFKKVTWSRCPDRLNKSVFRQLDFESGWLIWQWAPARPLVAFHILRPATWLRARLCMSSESASPTEFWCQSCIGSDRLNLAVRLQTLQPLDTLIDKWGKPPAEVVEDWRYQFTLSNKTHSVPPSVDAKLEFPLSHVLAYPDGQLLTLKAIESKLEHCTVFHASTLSDVAPPNMLPSDSDNIPRVSNALCLEDILEQPSDSNLAPHTESTKENILVQREPIAASSSLQLHAAELINPISTTSLSKHAKPTQKQKVAVKHRTIVLLVTVLIACTTLLTLSFTGSKEDESSIATTKNQYSNPAPFTPAFRDEFDHQEKVGSFDVNSGVNRSPDENAPLDLSTMEGAPDQLTVQADHSLQALLTNLGADKAGNQSDAAILDSVQDLISKHNSAKLVEDTLSKQESAMSSEGSSPSVSPFNDSITSEEMILGKDDLIGTANSKQSIELETTSKSALESGTFQASWSPTKSLEKKSIRVSFVPRDKVSVCRIHLSIPEPIQLKPEEPLIVAGRQDVFWDLAIEDDTVSLKVYLRSKPARAWYIATAVRVKLASAAEFPLGPTDANIVCSRLHSYLLSLDKQRSTLQAMTTDSKFRTKVKDAMKAVDEEIKQTDKNLKTWREIQELSKYFYESAVFQIDFASSESNLPPSEFTIPIN
jgi:hypothetical protein